MDEPNSSPLKIVVLVGTRPEAVKLAPLIKHFQEHPGRFHPITVLTAQHREMLDQVLNLFSIRPDHDLDILRPRQSLAGIIARAVTGLDSVLTREKPDFVVVQGDTSSTFAGALAAFYHRIAVAHVEAGLRTHRKFHPFPEEINRRLTSVVTDAHFAPTEESRANLLAEGISEEKIWVTGNTVIDVLQEVLSWKTPCRHEVLERIRHEKSRMILVTSHRRENQGEPQEHLCEALLDLVKLFSDIAVVFPVHRSPSVRDTILPRLENRERVILMDPIDYFETVNFIRASYLILTDSGGIQEEAPSLRKPVLVLRDTTERPEGVEAGTARLVGMDRKRIVEAASELLADPSAYARMSGAPNPYGDGKACERIAQALEFLTGRAESPKPFTRPVHPAE